MLQLPADLGFLDEPADQPGVFLMLLEQDLHGEISAEIGVAPLQNRTHASPGDLAKKLVALARGSVGGNL